MTHLLTAIAKRLHPDFFAAGKIERAAVRANLLGLLYALPVALFGLAWLLNVTDLGLARREGPMLALLFALAWVLQRLRFFVFWATSAFPLSAGGAMNGLVIWAGALLFGPTALWLELLLIGGTFVGRWRGETSIPTRLDYVRNLVIDVAAVVPAGTVALALYERWGGSFPLPGLASQAIRPALYATLTWSLLSLALWVPYITYTATQVVHLGQNPSLRRPFLFVVVVGLLLPAVIVPFGILAAGLYSQNGLSAFLFFAAGLLLVSLLARWLSQAVDRSQQRSRELAQLEQLGRAIIRSSYDACRLPELLGDYVPGMFPSTRVEIRLFDASHSLLHHPGDWPPLPTGTWEWLKAHPQSLCLVAGETLPWDQRPAVAPFVVTPVIDPETAEPIGGIYVEPQRDSADAAKLLPAVQSLAAQVASALHSARVYARTLAHQKVAQELALAGEIQASFLPSELPRVPGWQLTATLKPARQTSGDFYDVIPLPNGRLGLVIADVADKGTGAALYMALSRTLIRTYALEHHARPDFALRVANNRILSDAQAELFVTLFYGVLDPLTGKLTYCNAGHTPPFLLRAKNEGGVQHLDRTGIPLGIFRGETWERQTVELKRGDVLLLYTDGVTEAQSDQETFFGEEGLLAVARACRSSPAPEIQAALLDALYAFAGDAAQSDDIAVMVLAREAG